MKEKIDAFFRHPFTLAIAGTILASALIPWVVGRAQKQATLQDARIKQAIEIMMTSNSVNVTVNKMKTAFESFEAHSLSSSPPVYKERCKELEQTIFKLYGDFDSIAWWWPWNIYYQARLLRLIPKDRLDEFTRHIDAYKENVSQTAKILGQPWDAYLTGDPTPSSKPPIMQGLVKQLSDLQTQRDDLALKMAAEFQ
jgi:hypothetical protein